MFKFKKIAQYIKLYREQGVTEFQILTTSDEIIILPIKKEKGLPEQLRIKYK